MYCSNCGKKLDDNSAFCPNCGFKIVKDEPKPVVESNTVTNESSSSSYLNYVNVPTDTSANTSASKKSIKDIIKPIFITVCVIAVFITIVVAVSMVSNNAKYAVSGKGEETSGSSSGGSGNTGNNNPPLDKDQGTRTIMVYMIASNLESGQGSATSDIGEMMQANFGKDVNVLIYTGGTKQWLNDVIKSDENAIYEVNYKGIKKLTSFNKKSMVKADTLTEFINYVYDKYESDLYDLVLWDHGGGPLIGYGQDENFFGNMSLSELDKALNNSNLLKDTKFEMIGFDACLMASIEIANYLKEEANYLLASEESEPGYGWDYSFLRGIDKNTTSVDLGKTIVDNYHEFYIEQNALAKELGYPIEFNTTLSLIDLSKVNDVNELINNSFANVKNSFNTTTFSNIAMDINGTTLFGKLSESESYNLVDLYDLTNDIKDDLDDVDKLQNKLKELVVYSKSNIKDAYGITIFFPVNLNKNNIGNYLNLYKKFSFANNYYEFLQSYSNIFNGDRLVKSSLKGVKPTLDKAGSLQVTLPDDLVKNYLRSDYSIFVKNEYGGYFPVYRGRNAVLDGNVLSVEPQKKELVITDNAGKDDNFVTSYEYAQDKDSVTYQILAQLENVDFDDFRINNFYFFVRFENGNEVGEIIDIKPFENADEAQGKYTLNLNDYSHIVSMSSSYTLDDENGNALQGWQTGSVIYGSEYALEDGFKFMLKDFNPKKEYYYVFRVLDTQGNVYTFNKIKNTIK